MRLEICIPQVLDDLVYPRVYLENRNRERKRLLARAAQAFSIQPQLDRGMRCKPCCRAPPTMVRWNDLCVMKLPYICSTNGLSQSEYESTEG